MQKLILGFFLNYLEEYAAETTTTIDDQIVVIVRKWLEEKLNGPGDRKPLTPEAEEAAAQHLASFRAIVE